MQVCNDPIFQGYDQTSHAANMALVWEQIVRGTDWDALGMPPLKVLIFSGDDDAVCGVQGTERWLSKLSLNRTSFWQPWLYDDGVYQQQLGEPTPRPRTPPRGGRSHVARHGLPLAMHLRT